MLGSNTETYHITIATLCDLAIGNVRTSKTGTPPLWLNYYLIALIKKHTQPYAISFRARGKLTGPVKETNFQLIVPRYYAEVLSLTGTMGIGSLSTVATLCDGDTGLSHRLTRYPWYRTHVVPPRDLKCWCRHVPSSTSALIFSPKRFWHP